MAGEAIGRYRFAAELFTQQTGKGTFAHMRGAGNQDRQKGEGHAWLSLGCAGWPRYINGHRCSTRHPFAVTQAGFLMPRRVGWRGAEGPPAVLLLQPCPGLRFAQDLQHAALHVQRIAGNGAGAAIGLVVGWVGDVAGVVVSLAGKLADLFSGMFAGLQRHTKGCAAGADHRGFAACRLPVALNGFCGKSKVAAHHEGSGNHHYALHKNSSRNLRRPLLSRIGHEEMDAH
ncbi:hypothetical protein AGR3A_Cc300037 [Agrobacterium tomkonis CFBP 6623]|uniref:Uncharacterized protein n=1 Tax=Agrobacterium tomkonis CFBP 6623 TaxID=1183432 RepID=A0A1S7PTJ6_9HYPH|nr:hypothetical protein AGR3A_Cc300037 [Agrobacterium tomkonis CFBP 6623]